MFAPIGLLLHKTLQFLCGGEGRSLAHKRRMSKGPIHGEYLPRFQSCPKIGRASSRPCCVWRRMAANKTRLFFRRGSIGKIPRPPIPGIANQSVNPFLSLAVAIACEVLVPPLAGFLQTANREVFVRTVPEFDGSSSDPFSRNRVYGILIESVEVDGFHQDRGVV